jgi:hypothetical protein
MVQLPAVNTPQFEWVQSRLPGRAQPVPPIFQPEVAAEAIVWAAEHDRRELFVSVPTWLAIVGNSLTPALGITTSPASDMSRSTLMNPKIRRGLTICGNRSMPRAISVRTAASMPERTRQAGV